MQGQLLSSGVYFCGRTERQPVLVHLPCTGNKAEFCGGNQVVNVFEALENTVPVVTSTSSPIATVKIAATSMDIQAVATSNGAMKSKPLFGMKFQSTF
jgi:hypothetical protein